MLPNPTITSRPVKVTCTGCVMMRSRVEAAAEAWQCTVFHHCAIWLRGAAQQRIASHLRAASLAPVRRVRALVTGKRLHALDPGCDRGELRPERQQARAQFLSLAALERPQQHLDAGKHHDVGGRETLSYQPGGRREARLDGARFVHHDAQGALDLL